jgi:FkbM family methyltransferase
MAEAPFRILDILPPTPPMTSAVPPEIKVVDVGALPVPGSQEIYAKLIDLGLATVVGFEPAGDACTRLNEEYGDRHLFLPHFIGNGDPGTFRLCQAEMTSSLLEPNSPLLEKFQNLAELVQVVERSEVETRRLDDIPEVANADFVKLDAQGGELDIIEGADKVLQNAVVVHTEVEFVPLYQGQPLFAEIDQALRARGFSFHTFMGFGGRVFKPMIGDDVNAVNNQYLWSEAVYVKDFMALDGLTEDQLLKQCFILHEVYGSFDLVHHCLCAHDLKTGGSLGSHYLAKFGTAS